VIASRHPDVYPRLGVWAAIGLALLSLRLPAAEIHDAVLAHDIQRVRQLILNNAEAVNARNEKGDTPLYIAAFRGFSRQMVPMLLQMGADPNPAPNSRNETPLSIARELGKKQTAIQLLQAGAKEDDLSLGAEIRYLARKHEAAELNLKLTAHPHLVDARNSYGQTALTFLVGDEKPDTITLDVLLKAHANPNATNIYGGSPFSVAVENQDPNTIALLLKHGARENAISRSAPLRIAVRKNLLREAEEIVKQHPEMVRAHDDLLRTPLHLAAVTAGRPMVELLLKHGADVNAGDFAENRPLHATTTFPDKAEIVQLLLAAKANPNVLNRQLNTPLHNAALAGALDTVKALLQAGANLGLVDNVGETALHRAATGGHVEVMKLLLSAGMDPNCRDRQGQTALHQAAERGQVEAVKLLLDRKVNFTFVDVSGSTALALAERRQEGSGSRHAAVVKLLKEAPGK
jgi:ankyrin repeat protein